VITAHRIERNGESQMLRIRGSDNLATAIVAVGADVVASMCLTGNGFFRQRHRCQIVVRSACSPLCAALSIFLNGHL